MSKLDPASLRSISATCAVNWSSTVKSGSSRRCAARAMSCAASRQEMLTMYIPLPLRLTLFFTLLLGAALLFFGNMVYAQAEQRAYRDLDNALSSRAASVRLGKFLDCPGANPNPSTSPAHLPSVDALATGRTLFQS